MTDDAADLAEFLLARIEEDERIADYVASVSPTTDTKFCLWATQFAFDPERMIVAADYQRVIAECTAKRSIINDFLAIFLGESPFLSIRKDIQNNFRRTAQFGSQRCYNDGAINQDWMLQHKVN